MKPSAAISLDLDNLWSYLKIHGDESAADYPTYLPDVVPIVLDELDRAGLRATIFVVGRDADDPRNAAPLREIGARGHDLGNHSYEHEPWMSSYEIERVREEIARAEDAIARATGVRPRGFRGPGYAFSDAILDVLSERRYLYDASTLPMSLGPLARWYYFKTAKLDEAARKERADLFGHWSDALRPNRAHWLREGENRMLEIPVTVMPGTRFPFHASYLVYLSAISPAAATAYFSLALELCRVTRTLPSLLLHPLDFVGGDEVEGARFFPGMTMSGARKRALLRTVLSIYARRYSVLAMDDAASELILANPANAEPGRASRLEAQS